MSNTDYNNIISAINSVSQDYNYSPPSNNLICIDTSNNRIGINTLDPSYSLHINGGTIKATTVYTNIIVAESFQSLGDPTDDINVTAINVTNINVASKLDISQGTIKVANISVSNLLDISKGQIKANYIQTNKIDVSGTLDISRGLIKANYMQTNNIDVSGTLDISKGYIKVNNVDISGTLNISKGYIKVNNIDVSGTLDNSRGLFIANNIRTQSNVDISGNIIFNVSGGNITNVNKLSAPLTNYSIVSSSRVYQDISNDISWAAVNGYYGLAKDAYPALNPYSSGAKAVQTWTSRTTGVETTEWRYICWSPELRMFVAVASIGVNKVMISSNGINWTQISVSTVEGTTASDWRSVCWSQQLRLFVAVAKSGTHRVMTSEDGITWTRRTIGVEVSDWHDICWSKELGIFVAVAAKIGTYKVMTSSDGKNWTRETTENTELYGVCWSAELGLFVAVGDNVANRVMISSNGKTWRPITITQGLQNYGWLKVCWSAQLGLFAAVAYNASNNVMISNDGINWTSKTVDIQSESAQSVWINICWSAELSLFIAVAENGTYRLMTSNNGLIWTKRTTPVVNNGAWNGICWSPELGIAVAVSSLGNNRVMTSSLQGRPPTSYNVFDNSFNAIDENGNWTVKQLTVSDLSSVNISNFINSLITRINYLETYASFSQPDVTFTNKSSIIIPIDLSNNSSVEINAQFSFFGWSGYSNGEQRDTRLWSEYYDTSGNLRQWLTYNMDGYHQAREVNGSYFKNGESITKGQLMWYMSTDNFFGRAHTLKITLYRLIDKFNDGRFHNFEGTSMWSWSLGTISHYHVKFAGTFEYTPQSIAFYVADHNKLNLPPYETSFNIVYNLVNKRRTL